MVMPGECVNDIVVECSCGTVLNIGVYKSGAGWYIGFFCPKDGPYSRESGYYPTSDDAFEALKKGAYTR